MKTIKLGLAISVAGVLGACAADRPVGLPVFGDAVRSNAAVQVVNPMAPSDRGPLLANGERVELQQEKYVTDMVEEPADVGTLQGVQGGGGGGGGGAGGAAGAVGGAAQ